MPLPPHKCLALLPDGSYLICIHPSWIARRRNKDGVPVHVVEYVLDDPGRAPLITYRLITTIQRAAHRRWPQPSRTPKEAVRVLGAI